MARKVMTLNRYEEIQRRLDLKHSIRQIARDLGCSRTTVRKIQKNQLLNPQQTRIAIPPAWSEQVPWPAIAQEIRFGSPVKYLWEEHAKGQVTYGNFLKQFYHRYPEFKQAVITLREFAPGDLCEVDYSGTKIPWYCPKTKRQYDAEVFVGVLGFSQLIFACAQEDQKSSRFLEAHNGMYQMFGGVPSVTVCDRLKQGVVGRHLYDPDINLSYNELAKYYGTAIVPARSYHPKDKPFAEGAVKLVMRLFRWKYRGRVFHSIAEINRSLKEVTSRINSRPHSRFKVSRLERWQEVEFKKLKPLPTEAYEIATWKEAKLHPDSHICVDGNYYSAPHKLRGKQLKVKIGCKLVEIFHETERMAVHGRVTPKKGTRVTNYGHLPENSRAYREATPQSLLSQARFLRTSSLRPVCGPSVIF